MSPRSTRRFNRTGLAATAVLGVWLGACVVGAEAALSFSASVDRTTVSMNQPLRLTITLSGELPRFDAPVEFEMPKPFLVAARSQSTNVSIGAGTVERSISFIYVLVSPKAGTFVLGPFHLDVQGTTLDTESVSIVVKKPVVPPGAEQQPRVTL